MHPDEVEQRAARQAAPRCVATSRTAVMQPTERLAPHTRTAASLARVDNEKPIFLERQFLLVPFKLHVYRQGP